jgi:nitrite reductase/ring-hydroxylating ferredoxin subunit
MAELLVGRLDEFSDGDRKIVSSGKVEVGVFCWKGEFYAYSNNCLHQGGPACEGLVMHQVEDVLDPDGRYAGQRFSSDSVNFVCPWHGYEYDLRTGEFVGDRRRKLKSYPVLKRDDSVYVVIEGSSNA